MEESQTFGLVKRLAAELGYEIRWTKLANGQRGQAYSLDNKKGDHAHFSHTSAWARDRNALEWLRKRA